MHSSLTRTLISLIAMVFSAAVFAQDDGGAPQHADLVMRNGVVVTVDDAIGAVQAVAVRGGRITAVGSSDDVAAHIGPSTRIVDLDGRLAIPGFIEAHGHFTGMGEAKLNLDLTQVTSWSEVIAMVAEAVKRTPSGEWIVGRGWHQEKWTNPPDDSVEGFPTHWSLSEVSPDNPVLLTHASGHACFSNKKAMDVSGISAGTEDPPGGEILRDAQGQPIGIFREAAQALIKAPSVKTMSEAQRAQRLNRVIDLATTECLTHGVTTFEDAGSPFEVIDALAQRAESGTLGVRLWVMVREPNDVLRDQLAPYTDLKRIGADRFTLGGVKVSLDGALGSRGAWLLEPYADSPQSTGLQLVTLEQLETAARLAMQHELQMCVHAIGDRANREVLDLYEKLFEESDRDGRALRWRVEHAQHLHPDDIPRFGALGVIAAMQAVHCTSDGPWVIKRLGAERAERGAYMWRDLLDSGAVIANGTDVPVEPIDPIACFHSAVTRRMPNGERFFPDQCMTRMEALRSYTIDAAYAAKEEDIKGSLTPGKLADIVVLSKNILEIPAEEIPTARVDMTVLGGEIVFSRLSVE